ncbi:uncharacterized protein LOC126782139 [Argentina anserina]|uniref:uncharacterized protein LOC126782139 n=1 Tax=Argentina anserina TaxID=57926 RepID=UPI002176421E|nr:uncharacterized protein LOC126782139 [Potentilla anserina]
MLDGISSQFAATLAIKEKGKVVFAGAAGDTAISRQPFVVGHLVGMKKPSLPKAVIRALTLVWGYKNRLHMRAQGDRYILKFTCEERDYVISEGPWFYNKALFIMAKYDGLTNPVIFPILGFPFIVDIMGLPPALMTAGAVTLVGETLGELEEIKENEIKRGARARVWVFHRLSEPIWQAFPPMRFEFGTARIPAMLTFRYEHTLGFCWTCGLMEHVGKCPGPSDVFEARVVGVHWVIVI